MIKKALLEWHLEAGADEAIGDAPVDRFAPALQGNNADETIQIKEKKPDRRAAVALTMMTKPLPATPESPSSSVAQAKARVLADQATSLEELERAIREFDGCPLKKTCQKTVICRGNPKAAVMVIGEAPGQQEDTQGIPFCGPSGQLLDKILGSIGLKPENDLYISNTVFWRPPGNRQPSPEETAICLPFVEKLIALVAPKLLILSGGVATTTLLNKDTSISRLRGKLYEYSNPYLASPISTLLTYHPSYLLRQPSAKKLAWQDMLMAKRFLNDNS